LAGQFLGDGEVLIATRAVDFVFSDKPIPVQGLNFALFYKMSIRIFLKSRKRESAWPSGALCV